MSSWNFATGSLDLASFGGSGKGKAYRLSVVRVLDGSEGAGA